MGKRSVPKPSRSALPPTQAPSIPSTSTQMKDAEELDLEERLFGTKKRRIGDGSGANDLSYLVAEDAGAGVGMDGMDDGDLFMVDAPTLGGVDGEEYEVGSDVSVDEDDEDGAGAGAGAEVGEEDEIDYEADSADSDSNDEDEASSDSDDSDDSDGESDGASDVDIQLPADQYDYAEHQKKEEERKALDRKCVWSDPADETIGVDLSDVRRLKKLARGKREGEGKVGGRLLAARLREQFERIHPRPAWADDRVQRGVPSLSSLFSSTKSFIDNGGSSSGSRRPPLPQGTVELQRQRNANQQNPTTGKKAAANVKDGVVDFAWHPNPAVPVGAVAGGDRRVRFFHIDGETNPTLLTLHIPSLPLGKITYHPTGSSLLLTGNRPYYYTYDLAAQKCIRSSRNLFGSSPSPSAPNDLSRHSFSPDGSLLAVAGRRGAVSVLDWGMGGGTGAVVAELVSGRGGATAAVQWSADGRYLEVLGGRTGSEVEVWDVGERRVTGRVEDERAYGGKILRKSRDGEYTAIASTTGIVNLYSSSAFSINPTSAVQSAQDGIPSVPTLHPEPIKSLEHLTTEITSLDIHPSGEMLVAASKYKPKALKMYHLPSATAFSNWPTQKTPLYRVTTTNFSPSGEYLTVGNQKGQVLLWSLSHYSR